MKKTLIAGLIALVPFVALAGGPSGNHVNIDSSLLGSNLGSLAFTMDANVGKSLINSAVTVGTNIEADVNNHLHSKQSVYGSNLVSTAVVMPGVELVDAVGPCTYCGIGIDVGQLNVKGKLDNSAMTAGNLATMSGMNHANVSQSVAFSNLVSVAAVAGADVRGKLINTATTIGNSVSLGDVNLD